MVNLLIDEQFLRKDCVFESTDHRTDRRAYWLITLILN